MNCNGIQCNIFICGFLMILLLPFVIGEVGGDDVHRDKRHLGYNGNLYNLFKMRMEKMISDGTPLDFATEDKLKEALINSPKGAAVMSRSIYDEFKKGLEKFKYNADSRKARDELPVVRLAMTPIKHNQPSQREDKLQPIQSELEHSIAEQQNIHDSHRKEFKRHSKRLEAKLHAIKEPRRVIKEKPSMYSESLYDLFKKRLENVGSGFSVSGDNIFLHLGQTAKVDKEDKQKRHKLEDEDEISKPPNNIPNSIRERFYEEYRKQQKVNAELYGKDNWSVERSARNFRPSAHDFDYPKAHNAKRFDGLQVGAPQPRTRSCSNSKELGCRQTKNESQPINENPPKEDAKKRKKSIFADDSTYPAVLTKALESSLNPYTNLTPKSLLTTVAQKLHTTPLDLAKKLTKAPTLDTAAIKNDNNLSQMLQKYIESAVMLNASSKQRQPKQLELANLLNLNAQPTVKPPHDNLQPLIDALQLEEPPPCEPSEATCSDISAVLDKVLNKLEMMQKDKSGQYQTLHPEGAPCDLVGIWNSLELGLRFEINLGKSSERTLAPVEKTNKLLEIEAIEHLPPRRHRLMGTDWLFMGSAMKQLGGPFYMYTQNPHENVIATFTGACRTCGGIDTIFGSWTFLYPSIDCQDISAAFENKRDVMRRFKMDVKRKERYKDILYNHSSLSKGKCFKKL